MKFKSYEATFKAVEPADGERPGQFEAVVAVFDNIDSVGDRLKSTAFDATLKTWRESGDPIPVILAHKWDDPFAIVGHADPHDMKAIPGRGLFVKGQLHVGRGNDVADQVYHLMGERLIKEFSFAYTVPAGGEKKAADGAYDISELNLVEVGPCLKGVNPDTELLTLKSLLAVDEPRVDDPVDDTPPVDPPDDDPAEVKPEVQKLLHTPSVLETDPEIDTEVMVYDVAIENLESQLGLGYDDAALEVARLDADIDAQLGA